LLVRQSSCKRAIASTAPRARGGRCERRFRRQDLPTDFRRLGTLNKFYGAARPRARFDCTVQLSSGTGGWCGTESSQEVRRSCDGHDSASTALHGSGIQEAATQRSVIERSASSPRHLSCGASRDLVPAADSGRVKTGGTNVLVQQVRFAPPRPIAARVRDVRARARCVPGESLRPMREVTCRWDSCGPSGGHLRVNDLLERAAAAPTVLPCTSQATAEPRA